MKHPFSLYILCLLHLFVGLNALIGSILMMVKPDGSLLGMKLDWLANSPFENYFIPGIILFLLLGIFSLFIAGSLLRKPKTRAFNILNIYSEMHWSWTYSLYSGVITILWILVQMLMTQYFWLQPVIIFSGLLVIIFTVMPSTARYFKNK